jgi:hypothetical protein
MTYSRSDYTVIIQGPMCRESIDNIKEYYKHANVIISTWSNSLFSNDVIQEIEKYAKIIVSEPIYISKNYLNQANILYQSLSTYNGLINVNTKFSIKVRSDEKFTDLSKLLDKHKKNTDKIICSNIFFRKPKLYAYHISDHIICGRTDILLKSFDDIKNICNTSKNIKDIINIMTPIPNMRRLVPEQIICLCILNNILKDQTIDLEDKSTCVHLMKTHFDVIDVDSLGHITISFKDPYRKGIRCHTNSSRYIMDRNKDICFSMDEYR